MKFINTKAVLETKIRIYQIPLLEELSDYYERHKNSYRNKNDFYVSLIISGLEIEKIKDENYDDYNGKLQSISDKLKEIESKFDNVAEAINKWNKEDMVDHVVFEKLLSRILKLATAENQDYTLNKELLECGLYDILPNDIEEYKDEMQVAMGLKNKQKTMEEKTNL